MNKVEIIKVSDLDPDVQARVEDYPLNRKFDYIIIGASLSGIVIALELVKLEFKVLLLDKHRVAGGKYQSFFRKVNDIKYECEAFTDFCALKEDEWLIKAINDNKSEGVINFFAPKNLLSIVFNSGNIKHIPNQNKKMMGGIKQEWPLVYKSISKILEKFSEIHDDIMEINEWGKKYASAFDLVSEYCEGYEETILIFEAFAQYFIRLPLFKISAQNFIFNMSQYFLYGAVYPVLGFQDLIDHLIRSFELKGGFFLHKTNVVALNINDKNKITSVKLNYSKTVKSDTFISAISNNHLLVNLISNKKRNKEFNHQIYKIDKTVNSYSRVTLLLKTMPKELYKNISYFYINDFNLNGEATWQAMKAADYAKIPLNVANYPTLGKNIKSRPGDVITITFLDQIDNWKYDEGKTFQSYRNNKDYLIRKQKVAQMILKRVFKYLPEFKQYINKIELATPWTIRRYLYNLNGNPYGNLAVPNNLWQLKQFYTPYKNLYLANSSTFPQGTFAGNWKTSLYCEQILLSGINKLKKIDKKNHAKWKVDLNEEMNKHHVAELIDSKNFLKHWVNNYVPHRKYIGMKLGLSFSKEEHYVLEYKTNQIEIIETTLQKTQMARVYAWVPLPLFKDLVKKRTKTTKHTFQGTMKVTGGIKKFKLMLDIISGNVDKKDVYDPKKVKSNKKKRKLFKK